MIGAELSGLVAARELRARGVERLAVLEARDRVGGRTFNHDIGRGQIAEGGGQWIGPTQSAIHELCDELEVETFPTHLDGNLLYLLGSAGSKRMRVQLPGMSGGA